MELLKTAAALFFAIISNGVGSIDWLDIVMKLK